MLHPYGRFWFVQVAVPEPFAIAEDDEQIAGQDGGGVGAISVKDAIPRS